MIESGICNSVNIIDLQRHSYQKDHDCFRASGVNRVRKKNEQDGGWLNAWVDRWMDGCMRDWLGGMDG